MAMESRMVCMIRSICECLVDNFDEIKISEIEGDSTRIIEVRVAKEDTGKVIGRQGKTAEAIRTIVGAASGKDKKKTNFQIIDR